MPPSFRRTRCHLAKRVAILRKVCSVFRTTLTEALTAAVKAQDKRRMSTLRLITAALKDRDIDARGNGKGPLADDEIFALLAKMIKQRQESATIYADAGRPELAAQEREEIDIIAAFLPQQLGEDEAKAAIAAVVAETGAAGMKDMGKVMAVLKERFGGRMDFGKASSWVKAALG
ncbi:GatB/YqeY domain-containing protein [Blastochloris sulfoviridis]|uniref:GatB/YqeY domain-containing protein n=1 Tax=Blastochloris sulfoviridis TaxID=50712 RepID=A0A5M6I290_9HYPH|nr:GatB/YqeY domain-containing protein [Blastochloris sulfoviridis]